MQRPTNLPARRSAVRQGFTLIELMVSTAISVILVGGLSTCIFIASSAVQFESSVDYAWEAGAVVDQMARDIHEAQTFSVWTPTAVEFTVPDRNGDALPETIRYSWSGVAGDPLVKEVNGQPRNVAEDVHALDLTYFTKTF